MAIALQILSGVSVFGTIFLVIWKTLENSGINLKKKISKDVERKSYTPTKKECFKVFFCSILFRIFVIIFGIVIFCLFSNGQAEVNSTTISEAWRKWDAHNYIRIAEGYDFHTENGDFTTLAFFPLYSAMLGIVNLFIHSPEIAGLLVSAICTSIACVFMYKLVALDYGKGIGQKSVILMNVFPFGFFLGAIMSESAFILTSVMTLYYIRKHDWQLAGLWGMFSALSRSVGAFLIFPATIEFLEEHKFFKNFKDIKPKLGLIFKKWIWLLLIPIGTCIYLFLNYHYAGDPLYFIKIQDKYWNNGAQLFFKMPGDLWNWITSEYNLSVKMCIFIPALAMLIPIYYLMISRVRNHRTMYSIWLCVYLIVNTSLIWPLSICRYLACAVPIFIYLGEISEKNKKIYMGLLIGFSILFGIYLTGYLTNHQIM